MIHTATEPLILASSQPPTESCAPRADYALLAQVLGNTVLLYPRSEGSSLVSRLEEITACDLRQAITALRRRSRVSVYVSLSEKIGLPLALLLAIKRIYTPHILVAHHLTSPKKRALQSRIHWLQRFTRIVVLSEPQAAYLRDEAGYPEDRTVLLRDSVDTDFWQPQKERSAEASFILSVGQERRDYATLFAAARELPDLKFIVVAGSGWAARTAITGMLSPNVIVCRDLTYADLRSLYERASLVALPLEANILYAAGANGLLEAMAMGKPVVLTETPGLKGYVRQGENAHVVSPANPHDLVAVLRQMQNSSGDTARLGVEARGTAEARNSLQSYVMALAGIIQNAERER